MRYLSEKDIIRIMNEEWQKKLSSLSEQVDGFFEVEANEKDKQSVISKGLKVMHKKSKIRYTVHTIGKQEVILLSPEKKKFALSADEFEKEYELA